MSRSRTQSSYYRTSCSALLLQIPRINHCCNTRSQAARCNPPCLHAVGTNEIWQSDTFEINSYAAKCSIQELRTQPQQSGVEPLHSLMHQISSLVINSHTALSNCMAQARQTLNMSKPAARNGATITAPAADATAAADDDAVVDLVVVVPDLKLRVAIHYASMRLAPKHFGSAKPFGSTTTQQNSDTVDISAFKSKSRQRGTHQAWYCYPAGSACQQASECLLAVNAQNH